MGFFSKLFKRNEEPKEEVKGSVEEFVSLIRVYYQAAIAMQLGVTNMSILPDMALFKRMLKIPTQNNKLGIAERARVRKVLTQDYGLGESFFKEMDGSVKRVCKNQNDIKTYYILFQGFTSDLFSLMGNLMQWKFRFSMLVKKLLYNMTSKTVHEILTKSEWNDVSVQKAAWSVRKYAGTLGFSEQWITDFVYNVVLLAKEDQKRELKKNKDKKEWWRVMGLLFYADNDHFLATPKAFDRDKAIRFCRERGIALGDTAREVIRQKANASDKFLEVIVPIDLEAVLSELPACEAIVVTGQKALDTLLGVLASAEDPVVVEAPKVGSSVTFVFAGRRLRLYRMPSTSRAYPKPLAEKAAAYGAMLREVGIL